ELGGYWRDGRNEADQPAFKQPLMYKVIGEPPSPRAVFGARLVRERVVTEQDVAALDKALSDKLQEIYQALKKELASPTDTSEPDGAGKTEHPDAPQRVETAVRAERLVALNEQLLSWPSTFKLHPTMLRTLP